MQKFFHAQQIEQLRNSPSARRAFLIAVPIAVLVTISYILDPGRKMMLALCLLYSVFIVPKATKGVITKLTHVYVFTVVTFPFVAIAEYFQSGDTLMICYLMVFAVLNYEYGKRKWMDELAAARKARKRGQ